jgi:hypothetical protein
MGLLNCLFLAIALPLSLFLLVYGIFLCVTGKGDYGAFLLVIAALLLVSMGTGFLQQRGRKPQQQKPASGKNKPRK